MCMTEVGWKSAWDHKLYGLRYSRIYIYIHHNVSDASRAPGFDGRGLLLLSGNPNEESFEIVVRNER